MHSTTAKSPLGEVENQIRRLELFAATKMGWAEAEHPGQPCNRDLKVVLISRRFPRLRDVVRKYFEPRVNCFVCGATRVLSPTRWVANPPVVPRYSVITHGAVDNRKRRYLNFCLS